MTALALVMMLALGAAFLSQSTEYEPAIFSLLFGEILGVSRGQIVPVAVLGADLRALRRRALSPTALDVARARDRGRAGSSPGTRRYGRSWW